MAWHNSLVHRIFSAGDLARYTRSRTGSAIWHCARLVLLIYKDAKNNAPDQRPTCMYVHTYMPIAYQQRAADASATRLLILSIKIYSNISLFLCNKFVFKILQYVMLYHIHIYSINMQMLIRVHAYYKSNILERSTY